MGGAFDEGFLFDELSEVKQDILRSIKKLYPKESENFLKKEAKKLLKTTKKVAKKEVGTSKDTKKNWDEKKILIRAIIMRWLMKLKPQ